LRHRLHCSRGLQNLATLVPAAVLAALAAGAVRDHLGVACRVWAIDDSDRRCLPRGTTMPGVTTRDFALGDSHDYSFVGGPAEGSGWDAKSVNWLSFAHRGSIASPWLWSGSSASRAPHSAHRPGQSGSHTGFSGSVSTTASVRTGSRSS